MGIAVARARTALVRGNGRDSSSAAASASRSEGGHAALRLEVSVEGSTCTDGIGLWYGNEFSLDRDAIVYLVEMDGDTLAIVVWYTRSQTSPAQLVEAEAIVDSIQIER
jgi:hypothetical protein